MAQINLIYFGSVLDITGLPSETLEAPASLDDLREQLIARYPGLSTVPFRFSVNRQLVSGHRQMAEGDEIALLPPFAGG